MRARLLQTQAIDAVFTVRKADANSAISGIAQAGKEGRVHVCGLPISLGMAAALGPGVLVGVICGLSRVKTSVPSRIITLATRVAMQGVALSGCGRLPEAASLPRDAPGWTKPLFGRFIAGNYQVIIPWRIGFPSAPPPIAPPPSAPPPIAPPR